jgi:VanZ family protein
MDKVLHFVAFATWGLAMSVALAKQRLFQTGVRFEVVMMVAAAIFGTILECVQGVCVPSRSADLMDVVADVAGVALALLTFRVIFGCRPGRIATD